MNSTYLVRPFLISLGGVVSDYITTRIGLGMGLVEKNPLYSPFLAIMVFWIALVILSLSLPKGRIRKAGMRSLALFSYFASTHNILVIFASVSS